MLLKYENFVVGTLQAYVGHEDTTLTVLPSTANALPEIGANEGVKVILFDGVQPPEIVLVTAKDGQGNLTVSRAQEGTVGRPWNAGTAVRHTMTAELLNLIATFFGTNGDMMDGQGRWVQNRIVATADQVNFSLGALTPAAKADLWVYRNGQLLDTEDWELDLPNTRIVMDSGMVLGDVIIIRTLIARTLEAP